jgi:Mrp family chromosome partitioning ATPase/capsular polysaccharide biosynthesis protein
VAALESRPSEQPSNVESSSVSFTLVSYLGVFVRRKWVVLPPLVIVPLVAVAIALRESPVYQASAQVLLSHQNLAATLSGVADTTASLQPDRIAQTQADLARVPAVAQRTLAAVGLHDRSALDFLKASGVSTASNADLLGFAVQDRSPTLAKRLATEYARQFIAYRNELDSTALDRARNSIQRRLDELRAAGATKSPLYADLTAKAQQLITIESLQTTSALLVRPADSAPRIEPRPKRNAVLGVGLGLLLGIGLAFLRDALDTRVRNPEEIGEHLGLPLLARLPSPSHQLREQAATEMLHDPSGPYAESIRTLRVRLGLATPDPAIRVVMVTSATECEGKSTTVANLAVALAQAGRKVVLCDLDARRPVIARFFGIEDRPGLIDVALGRVELEQALTAVAIPAKPYWPKQHYGNGSHADLGRMLEVLSFGQTPPDPAEFVGSDKIAEILGRLLARADVVLVDAPSMLGIGDAMTLSSNVDALLIVARVNVVRRSTLRELRRVLASCPAPTIGLVATGASFGEGYGYTEPRLHPVPAERESESAEGESVRR